MAVSVERVCDKHRDRIVAAPTEMMVRNIIWTVDACEECEAGLAQSFSALGFRLAKSRVGSRDRAAHVAASGKPFTTRDARAWLAQQGYQPAPGGRLSKELLRLYADAH